MSRQIILRPDGLIAVWSTVVDDFIMDGVSIEDYVAYRREEGADEVEKDVREIHARLLRGERPYFQFTMGYKEACEARRGPVDVATNDE